MADREWPSHSEELARKSLETLHRYLHAHQAGKCPAPVLRLVVDVITDCTQGLIPNDVFDVIYAVRQELDKK